MSQQKTGFLTGEADAWYQRNASLIAGTSALRDLSVRMLCDDLRRFHRPSADECTEHSHPEGVRISRPSVLEIGCGNGENLAALGRLTSIDAHGIEPSTVAVEAGLKSHPSLQLRPGTADSLPFGDGTFDAVWFGFCLYLVDRDLLSRCVAEADRVLRDGGTLCIVDFDPDVPCRRSYHHRPGFWSYKMNYPGLFLANPAYRLTEKRSVSHSEMEWHPDPQERVGIWLCRKDLANAYR